MPIEETVEALQQVVADGKARYLGFSEWTAEQIEAAIEIAGPDLFVSSQPQYSMLWRAPEPELFPLCVPRTGSRRSSGRRSPGRADREVPARRAAAGGLARGERAMSFAIGP